MCNKCTFCVWIKTHGLVIFIILLIVLSSFAFVDSLITSIYITTQLSITSAVAVLIMKLPCLIIILILTVGAVRVLTVYKINP